MYSEITPENDIFKKIFKNRRVPFKKLYIKGHLERSKFSYCVGIAGSRQMSMYGKRMISKILNELSDEISIITGFMRGVDTEALSVALELQKTCIAVMPCGIDYIYPYENSILYKNILNKGGLIISEFAGYTRPAKWTYPRRNLVLSALCDVLVVIESGAKSGTMITASYAHKFNVPVFAAAGDLFQPLMAGNYQILNDYASVLISGSQINKLLGLAFDRDKPRSSETTPLENKILEVFSGKTLTATEVGLLMHLSISEIVPVLNQLVLKGILIEQGGYYYAC